MVLGDFIFTFHSHALEKEMATHSSVLAWRIPGTGEPGGLLSMGSHRVGHDWSDLAAAALVAQNIMKLSAMQETWVWSLGCKDPLEKGMATHYSILAWRIPRDRGASWATVMGLQRVRHGWSNLACSTHIGDGMGSAYLNLWQGVRDPGLLGAFIICPQDFPERLSVPVMCSLVAYTGHCFLGQTGWVHWRRPRGQM